MIFCWLNFDQLITYTICTTHVFYIIYSQLVIANMTDPEALRRHHLADYLYGSAGRDKLVEGGHRYAAVLVNDSFVPLL